MASEERLSNFDVDLQRFYFEALNKELDVLHKQNAWTIKSALKEVVEAYKRPIGDALGTTIRFDSAAKRCAYVLKHSPCFTSAVARHVTGLAENCPTVFHAAMLRGEVKLCCLGGGPASDAVGVCKVLSTLYRRMCRDKCLKVRVTVVDVNEDWAVTASNVLRTMTDSPELLGVEGVELSLSFLSADLTLPIEGEVKHALEDADVVTMVYFLSAVNRGRDTIESMRMVKEIMRCCREGSILFFLDSAMDVHYRQMYSAAKSLGNLEQVYGPRIEEFHTLSLQSVMKFLELYKQLFGRFLCLTNCFVSSSAWHKTWSDCTSANLLGDWTSKYLSLDQSVVDNILMCKRLDLRGNVERCFSPLMYDSQMENSLLVGRLLMDKCARLVEEEEEEEDSLWRNSHGQAVRLTAKMMHFRAQIGKLLADEFDEVVENEILDDEFELPPDDAFDHLLVEYCSSVPEYFFQTKSKKKRIFTGLPVSI